MPNLGRRLAAASLVAAGMSVALTAAVRPPKLEYQITTLPNGLTVVLE